MHYKYQFRISTSNLSNFLTVEKLLKIYSKSNLKKIILPKKLKRFTFVKSPHVNKSSKEHFQIIKYNRLFCVTLDLDSLKQFLLKLPNSLTLKIKKF